MWDKRESKFDFYANDDGSRNKTKQMALDVSSEVQKDNKGQARNCRNKRELKLRRNGDCPHNYTQLSRSGLLLAMWSHYQTQSGPPTCNAHACVAMKSAHAFLRIKDGFLGTYIRERATVSSNLFSHNIYTVLGRQVMRIKRFIDS